MIYYINENNNASYETTLSEFMIESSSVITDMHLLSYVNESAKDKVVGFFKKIIEKIREFFRKVKTFFQKSSIYAKIKSFKTKIESTPIPDGPVVSFSLPDPANVDYEKTILDIQQVLRKWLKKFTDQRAKQMVGMETDTTYDYQEIKDSFSNSSIRYVKNEKKDKKLR